MHSVIFLLIFVKISHACLDHVRENTLYKIKTMAHARGSFYSQENLEDSVISSGSQTYRPKFLWYLVKHPMLPTTYRLFNYNVTGYLWEANPKARTWNSALSNCTNDNQWIQIFNIEGDQSSNENYTTCILLVKDSKSSQCFLYQGLTEFLRQINCSWALKNDTTQKATNLYSVFEFYKTSEPREHLHKSCDVSSWSRKPRKCKSRRHPKDIFNL